MPARKVITSNSVNWFIYKHGRFEHYFNLAAVSQWLYCPKPEHCYIWMSCDDHLTLEGVRAREFRALMLNYMGMRKDNVHK